MSLRSRTLRAKLLRLSRRAMRLANRAGAEAGASGMAVRRFAQLAWRRARGLPRVRTDARAVHVHESRLVVRPSLNLALALHFAAAKAAAPLAAAVRRWSGSRRVVDPARTGGAELRAGRVRTEWPLMRRPPPAIPLVEALGRMAPGAAHGLGPLASRRPWSAPVRAPDARMPAAARGSGVLPRPEHRRVRRESAIAQRANSEPAFPSRLRPPSAQRAHAGVRPAPRVLLQHRHAVEALARGARLAACPSERAALTASPPRPPLQVPLHYASPRSGASPSAAVTAVGTAPAPPPAPPELRERTAVPQAGAPAALDRAMTDRLADEVIRRIERRVRIERERRGI